MCVRSETIYYRIGKKKIHECECKRKLKNKKITNFKIKKLIVLLVEFEKCAVYRFIFKYLRYSPGIMLIIIIYLQM